MNIRSRWAGGLGILLLAAVSSQSFAAPHGNIVVVSSGWSHTCIVMSDFRVGCWGDSTASPIIEPSVLAGLDHPIQLASASDFTCALLRNGTVWCWGGNSFGQLGDGTFNPHGTPAPVYAGHDGGGHVIPFGNVTAIAAGGTHACALRTDTSVWCWGSNTYGELGNWQVGVPNKFNIPITVVIHDPANNNPQLLGVTTLGAGVYGTCITFADSTGACWGDNSGQELGSSVTPTSYTDSPTTVLDGQGHPFGFAGGPIWGGWRHNCGLAPDISGFNSATCWGENDQGQVGDDIGASTDVPAPVLAPDGTTKILQILGVSSGYAFSCALRADTTIACWGDHHYGQLGTVAFLPNAYSQWWLPVETRDQVTITGYTQLSAGYQHACAIRGNGLQCWGDNTSGQLADGTVQGSFHNSPEDSQLGGLDLPIFADGFGTTWHD